MIDFNVAPTQTIRTPICVIGSGPAGATIARLLGEAGIPVTLLEAGVTEETDRGRRQLDIELVGRDYPLSKARRRALGGTSAGWNQTIGLRVRPLDDVDFQERNGLPPWPIEMAELQPYYARACELLEVPEFATIDVDAEYAPSSFTRFDGGVFRHAVFQRAKPMVARRWLQDIRNVPNVDVLMNANVLDLRLDANSVDHAIVDIAGERVAVEAKIFVMAGGGLENARLLLSSNGQVPCGIGNEHDLVGRFFMEHPHVESGFVKLNRVNDAAKMSFFASHTTQGVWREGYLSPTPRTCERLTIPNSGIWLRAQSARGITKRLLLRQAASAGRLFTDSKQAKSQTQCDLQAAWSIPWDRLVQRQHTHRIFAMEFQLEQTPLWDSRVMLSRTAVDEFGVPRVQLDWQIANSDLHTIRILQDEFDSELRRYGIGRVENKFGDEFPAAEIRIGNHHIGTTRMHTEPSRGVVNANCRVHSMDNLFIAGSSVFPRSGAANPTLAIMAFSCRLANHLIKQLSPGLIHTTSQVG